MANQLIGNSEVAIHMYQALYGQAPSNSLYDSYVSNINATSPAAFAAALAGNFNTVSDSALATQVLTNLGITATTLTATPGSTAAQSYTALSAAVVQLFAAYPTMRGQIILNMTNLLGNLEGDATYGAAATAYNQQATADLVYASDMGHTIPGVAALTLNHANTLTTGVDHLSDTTFFAPLNGTANTLQSGDTLTGTGAANVLSADLAAVDGSGVAPTTTNVQTISITSYDQANVTGNNTLSNSSPQIAAEVLAGLMTGVTNWVDGPAAAGTAAQGLINPLPGSRADVVIENIQLPHGNTSSDVTSAVTFTLRNTEPGLATSSSWLSATGGEGGNSGGGTTVTTASGTEGPNFRAYFNQQALKQAPTLQSNSVVLAVGNATPMTDAAFALNPVSNPITDANQHPFGYSGFTLGMNSAITQTFYFTPFDIAAIENATDGAQEAAFLQAVKDAVDINNGNKTLAQLNITASTGVAFDYFDQDGTPRSVPSVLLSGAAGTSLTAGAFVLNGTTSGTSGQQNEFIANPTTSTPENLITSNIILDNVGLGAMPQFNNYSGSTEGPAGDVVIGSLATSGGVQQFNVDVQNGSWINSLSSTNNTLKVVNINSDAVVIPTGGQYLAVGAELSYGATNLVDYASAGLLVGTNGFTDVQTINALNGPNGAFNGSLLMGETLDYAEFGKVLANATSPVNFSITLGNQSNGVVLPGQTAMFNSVHLVIDASVASSGNFKETITGGTGNDLVDVTIGTTNYHSKTGNGGNAGVNTTTTINPEAAGNWVVNETNLKNLVINAGLGNNIVAMHNSGAAQITANGGNDTFYIDNSGGTVSQASGLLKAVWVANDMVIPAVAAPTAVETAGVTGVTAFPASETITWQGFTATSTTTSNEAINGITVTVATPGAYTAADVANEAAFALGAPGALDILGLTGTTAGLWTYSNLTGNQLTVVEVTATNLPLGSTSTGTATAGAVSLPSETVIVAGIANTSPVTESQLVTWKALNGLGATETIDGVTVTDINPLSNVVSAAIIAQDVFNAIPGTLYTDAINHITVMIPTSTATTYTAALTTAGQILLGQDTLTYGTPTTTYSVGNLVGTSTLGTTPGAAPVSIDQYGNFTTNVGAQASAPHTFTGAGEQVSVTFDGYTTAKALISADAVGVTYTTAQINNAIMTAVNSDPVMNKLLHVTLGSAGTSLIISSLVDGVPVAPTINFGNDGSAFAHTTSAPDLLALSQYVVQNASGDGATTGSGWGTLTGAVAVGTVNNSSITDSGGTNVIDLSSSTGSVNTVTLTGTGTSYLINVGTNEVISTVPTHTVVINGANGGSVGTTVAMGTDTAPVMAGSASTAATLALFLSGATAAAAHTVSYEVFAGNMYYADANGVVVELVGTHTANVVAGLLHIAS